MLARRLAPELVTPRYEDEGLFKSELCSLNVALLPGPTRTDRQDIVFDGLVDKTYRAPVVFAGRRAAMAALLEDAARRLATPAEDLPGADMAAPLRRPGLALRIDGAWRRLVGEDALGFAQVRHQFIAAVWTISTGSGALLQFGMPPVR